MVNVEMETYSCYLILQSRRTLTLSSLPISWVVHAFNHCKAENKLLVLDCCYADAGRNNPFKSGRFESNANQGSSLQKISVDPQNYLALLAGDHLEKTQEIELQNKGSMHQGGFLSVHIYLALTERFHELDKDKDGKITIDDLRNWLFEQANEYNNTKEKNYHIPRPMLRGKAQGPFYLNLQTSSPKQHAEFNKDFCPYQGLEPFSKRSSPFFYGRENVIEEIKHRLKKSSFIFVAGASGSGKSSVVQAKVSPYLEELGWKVLDPIVPWIDPASKFKIEITQQLFPELSTIQAQDISERIETDGLNIVAEELENDQKTLIVIDQFEEVFTANSNNKEQQDRFIEILTKFIDSNESRLAIIATIRADFIEDCLSYSPLTRVVQNNTVWLPPLKIEEIQDIIIKPAEERGYTFQVGLPDLIIKDIGVEEHFLPLLEFALKELWDLKDDKISEITIEQYKQLGHGQGHALGGVLGALNKRAEEIFTTFTEREKAWAKRVFVRLVRTGLDSRDTR